MSIIYIFGPSCSGKSTLSHELTKRLGHQWTYLDRDELIEKGECLESAADETLEEKIKTIGNRIIVDAQIPWRSKKEHEFYCLLLPPLETLLERDAKRTVHLARSASRASQAKKYVVSTYQILSQLNSEKFDLRFDSSKIPAEEIALRIISGKSLVGGGQSATRESPL
jgi:cytidylate kinase